jgi:hypothetical protein
MQTIHDYAGFKVDRNELAKLFYIIFNPEMKNADTESGFGYTKFRFLKYYLQNFNLVGKNYLPTDLGKLIYTYDKYFEDEVTYWVLLYHWSKKASNPFLYFLINESFDAKNKDELKKDFRAWAVMNEIKIDYDKKDFVGGLIARTLNSFTDNDAFKNLNIFTVQNEKYYRDIPYKAIPLLIAYVLYDNRLERTTISFDELLKEPNNIGKLFNLDRELLQQNIYAMRDLGLLQYVQSADLHHIIYTYKEIHIKLLERYYEQY